MASITTTYPEAYPSLVFLDPLELLNFEIATLSEKTSSGFTIDARNNAYVFTVQGSGFRYGSDGLPTQGIITEIHGIQGGTPTYDIVNIQLNVATLFAWFAAGRSGPHPLYDGNDTVIGGSGNDRLYAYYGHDVLMGGANSDRLWGGPGNDHIYGQSPNGGPDAGDDLSGDGGSDYIQGNAGNDTLRGGEGSDRIFGGAGNDLISGEGSTTPLDLPGNDTINGNLGNDTIQAGGGNDSVRGGQGNDLISGGDGNDVLMGDKGDDAIYSGRGLDILTGGEGKDVFSFGDSEDGSVIAGEFATTGPDAFLTDIVTDFMHGEDRLAFSTPAYLYADRAVDAEAAFALAQTLVGAHRFDLEVAAISVENDTYIFVTGGPASGSDSTVIKSAILLLDVDSTTITASDFGFWAV